MANLNRKTKRKTTEWPGLLPNENVRNLMRLRDIAWWAYFILVLVQSILGVLLAGEPRDWLVLGFSAWGLVGLFGYLVERPILARSLWIVCFIAIVIAIVSYGIRVAFHSEPAHRFLVLVGVAASFAVASPLLYAIYRYAHHPSLWRKTSVHGE